MSVEDRPQRIQAGQFGIAGNIDHPSIVPIRLSSRRLKQICERMAGGIIYLRPKNDQSDPVPDINLAYRLASTLFLGLIDDTLREVLTPGQYQKALKANRDGRTVKFLRARR